MDKELKSLYPNIILPEKKKIIWKHLLCIWRGSKIEISKKKYLDRNHIETKVHYPIPLHLQKPGKKLGYKKGDFRNAELQSKQLLTLPVHQFLSKKQLKYMVKKIRFFYNL